MIRAVKIKIKISYNNINHFKKNFGNIKIGDGLIIEPNQLPPGSHKMVDCVCDICGLEKKLPYRDYLKSSNNGGYFSCNKCKKEKIKNTLKNRYGYDNYYNKEKYKQTCLKKFGVENAFQDKNVKQKIKNTCSQKYGAEHISQTDFQKNKTKETCLKKYGFEHHLKNNDILEKQHKTNIDRYGVKCVSQNKDVMKKIVEKSKTTREKTFLKKQEYLNIKKIDYKNKVFTASCDLGENHDYEIGFGLFANRKLLKNTICTICNPINSLDSDKENSLLRFIRENYDGEILNNNRDVTKQEIDIFLPDINLGFEFNGLYWHSEVYKNNNYHLNKTEDCEKMGIHLIHIYEDDWIYKQDIIKSRILNLLGKSGKIYARKCSIKEVNDNKLIKDFLDNNHIQGFVGSKIKIGLFYQNELVCLMTFGYKRKSMGQKGGEGTYEMLRFCNRLNTNVIGGASRLFKHFVKNYNPKEVISYADRSWSQGGLYENLRFQLIGKTDPNYYYFKNKKKLHRFNFRKDKLIKDGFDPNKTEHEIMIEREIYRIYNSGNLKFIWTS